MFFSGSPSEKSDEELLHLYRQERDLKWLSVLYLRYTRMVYGVCLKYLKHREEAQDAVMQVYEKLSTDLHRHEIQHFRGWLYVNARNHCLMWLRAHKGKLQEEISPFLMENGQAQHPEEEAWLDDREKRLADCLSKLAQPQQACVTLFFLEEKCYKEISGITGFDANQVKSYIQNGKRNLKICMESHG